MRIGFFGKGGSGKTTASAGFIRHAAAKRSCVLALDADVNAHLATALGTSGKAQNLGQLWDQITTHLKGQRTDLGNKPMIMTTPPSLDSNFIRCSFADGLVQKYGYKHNNIALLTVGKYEPTDVGSACYHSKLSGAVSMLHHLLDGANDIVVADNTAGTDVVATSLWFAYDMHVFIVEPTQKSAQVYKDFVGLLPHAAEHTYVLGNKIDGDEDQTFLKAQVGEDRILGYIPLSRHLKRFEQGHVTALDQFQAEQSPVFEKVLQTLLSKKRDWDLYLKRLRETHSKLCRDWYDTYYGQKLDEGLDANFRYQSVLSRS